MGWNPFSAGDWQWLGGSMGSAFSQFGGMLGDGFTTGFRFVVEGGTIIEGQLGNGALIVYRGTEGVVNYAVDWTKVTAGSTQSWVNTAAGDVADFSVEAYNEGKQLGEAIWKAISTPGTPPVLGPHDPIARECMRYMFTPPAVTQWERDAVSKKYTMAIDFRATAALPGISQTAFSGIYIDSSGQWGFIAQTGTGVSINFNANVDMEIWMVFGDRNEFQAPCYMPGFGANVKLPSGTIVTGGVNILLKPNGAFKGFRVRGGGQLLPSEMRIAPDAGPPGTSLTCYALSEKAPSYSAAGEVVNSRSSETTLLATAVQNTLPFVRKPNSDFFIQCKHSGKVLEVGHGSTSRGAHIHQRGFTGATPQRFRFENQGDGSFVIVPRVSAGNNQVLDVEGGSGQPGKLLMQWDRHGKDNQKFQFTSCDDGYFSIIAKHSGLAMHVWDASHADRYQVSQIPWVGQPHLQFRFIEVHEQHDWRWCNKCQGLWFCKMPSACPAGGAHNDAGSGRYYLLNTGPESYGMLFQDRWRWCNKCSSLFFGGNPGSKCAKDGGLHDSRGSGNYVMAVSDGEGDRFQGGWRWCNKCQNIWFSGSGAGVCAAGGGHDAAGSANYALLST